MCDRGGTDRFLPTAVVRRQYDEFETLECDGTEPEPWTARSMVALSSPLPTLAAQLCLYGRPLQMSAIV